MLASSENRLTLSYERVSGKIYKYLLIFSLVRNQIIRKSVPARVLVKKQQRPIWLEQLYFHSKNCQVKTEIT